MVRKTASSSNNNNTPCTEKVDDQSSNRNMKSLRALEPHLENLRANGAEAPPVKISANGVEAQKKLATLIRKKSKTLGASVRRSDRIKSAVVQPPSSSHIPEYIEDLTGSDSAIDEVDNELEKDMEEPESEPAENLNANVEPEPEPADNLSEKTLNEKLDNALRKLDVLDKIIELLVSKVDGNIGLREAPSKASLNFKRLYFSSQKKVEALTEENRMLTGKLENALGKIEVYEKIENLVPIEVLDKLKDSFDAVLDKMKDTFDAVVAPYRAKTSEVAVDESIPITHNACSATALKRKRNES